MTAACIGSDAALLSAALWVLVYFVSGPCLIVLNSHVLRTLKFAYPVFFSALGVWGSAVLGQVLVRCGVCRLNTANLPSVATYKSSIIPLSLFTAMAVALGNSVYIHQSVAFTQMLKALGPVYLLGFLSLAGLKRPSASLLAAVAVIVAGTALASLGEMQFSLVGFCLQVSADVVEASKLVALQWLMSKHKYSPMETIYHVMPVTSLWLAGLVCWREPAVFGEVAFFRANWHFCLAAVLLGFAINFAGSAVIQHFNSLTFKLISVFRNNALVIFAVSVLGNKCSALQALGYAASMAGFYWYTVLEQQERKF